MPSLNARTFACPAAAVSTDSHLASAGGAIRAAQLVLEGREQRAFALVRPPGHHAMRVVHGNRGFCNINNEAVMVEYIRDHYPHPDGRPLRIAIVDTDVHHATAARIFSGTTRTPCSFRCIKTATPCTPALAFARMRALARLGALSIFPCRPKLRTRAICTPSNMRCCPFWKISSQTRSSILPGRTTTLPTPLPT